MLKQLTLSAQVCVFVLSADDQFVYSLVRFPCEFYVGFMEILCIWLSVSVQFSCLKMVARMTFNMRRVECCSPLVGVLPAWLRQDKLRDVYVCVCISQLVLSGCHISFVNCNVSSCGR